MRKTWVRQVETPDATLRVSKRTRDRLKSAAASMGRSLYDVTNEVVAHYLRTLKLPAPKAWKRKTPSR